MELDARLGKPCNKILRNLIHVHKYVLAYACVYVARCQRMLQAYVTDVVEYVFMFLENISTFLKKDNRLLKKDKGVLKKGQHVSAYMPIMFSVHYSITKPIFFLLHLSFHLIKKHTVNQAVKTGTASPHSRFNGKRLRDSILSLFFHSYIFAMYKNESLWI